jgi:hypothetical protein
MEITNLARRFNDIGAIKISYNYYGRKPCLVIETI